MKGSKVIFINPPIADLVGTHYRMNPSLGAPLLTAILRKAGHNAYTLDAEALQLDIPNWLKKQERPDVIGMTVTYLNRKGASRLLSQLKQAWPDTRYIAGGPHATACPDEVLDLGFDVVAKGEADRLVGNLVDGSVTGGICEQGELTRNLDNLPFPDFVHHNPKPSYYLGNEPYCEHPEGVSIWNLGCPSYCVFCSLPVYRMKPVRFMSPQRIYDELTQLRDNFGIKHVFVYSDELIGMSKKQNRWIIEVCEKIAPLGLTYKTQGRCSKWVTVEALQAMKDAGFKWIFWGIESLSQRVLNALDKGTDIENIWQVLRLSKQAGIANLGFFMVGCLEEQLVDFNLTYNGVRDMLKEGLLQKKQVTIMTAEPGSRLYDLAKQNNWLENLEGRSHYSPNLSLPWFDHNETIRRQEVLSRLS